MNQNQLAAVIGEVLGEVLGDDGIEGDDEVGARRRARGGMLRLPPKPAWRRQVITPGVNAPSVGTIPLPLVPDAGGGTFTSALTFINFRARPQKPFQGQRLLAQVFRTGASASGLAAVTSGVFIGTDLQQGQIGQYNLEFFTPTAFGVSMVFQPAEAGIDIVVPVNLTGALAPGDLLSVQLLILGETIR